MTDPKPQDPPQPHREGAFRSLEERKANGTEPLPVPSPQEIDTTLDLCRKDVALKMEEAQVRGANAAARLAEAKARSAEGEARRSTHEAEEAGHRAAAEPRRQKMALDERKTTLELEVRERMATVVMKVVVTLAIVGIQIAGWIVSPWFFPLNLLIACLGYWAKQRFARTAPTE